MLKERLKQVRKYLKIGSQKDFSSATGWTIGRIQDLESGKVQNLKAEEALFLQEKFLINGWWLLTGKDSMLSKPKNSENYTLDVLNVKASAGSGIVAYDIEVIDKFVIDKKFFKTPPDEKTTKIIKVEGDSMEPTLQDGSYVAIDENKCDGVDGIYACIIGDGVRIKRLQFNLDGTIKIISDNSKYEAQIYNPNDSQIYFKIIGRKTLTIQR